MSSGNKQKVIKAVPVDEHTYKYVFEDLSYFTMNLVTLERHYYNKNAQLHREDGPAETWGNGDKNWWSNGHRHRENGPAVEWVVGHREWYINGQTHREDGPAIIFSNGDKRWYKNDQRHREDGPAVVDVSGYKEWYLNGKEYSEQDWKAELKRRTKK